jgi:hypothetical protein
VNFDPDTTYRLRTLLSAADGSKERRDAIQSQANMAQAAASRLSQQIADLDQQALEAATPRIRPDQERVQRLIAGEDVPQADKKEIEARAQKGRHIAAQRQQIADDLAAVQDHLAALTSKLNLQRRESDAAELALLQALGEAQFQAYKAAAVSFLETYVPPLHSIANLVGLKAGARPAWWFDVQNNLSVGWCVPSEPLAGHPGPITGRLILAWPRVHPDFGDKLISGQPSHSPDIVAGLISQIREYQEPAAVHPEGAAVAPDAASVVEAAAA